MDPSLNNVSEPPPPLPPGHLGKVTIFTQKFLVGDRVRANWKERGKYFPGTIVADHGNQTFEVHYDDGDREKRVKERYLRMMDDRAIALTKEKQKKASIKGAVAVAGGGPLSSSIATPADDEAGLYGFTLAQLLPMLENIEKTDLSPYVTPGEQLTPELSSRLIAVREENLKGTHARVSAMMKHIRSELDSIKTETYMHTIYSEQELPLAGVKRTMRFEALETIKCEALQPPAPGQPAPRMGPSQEAVLAMAKALEIFVLELTLRSWCAKAGLGGGENWHELSGDDVWRAMLDTEPYDVFLALVSRNKPDANSSARTSSEAGSAEKSRPPQKKRASQDPSWRA